MMRRAVGAGLIVVWLGCTPNTGGLGSSGDGTPLDTTSTAGSATDGTTTAASTIGSAGSGAAASAGGETSTTAEAGSTAALDGGTTTGLGTSDEAGSSSSGGLPTSDLPVHECGEEAGLSSVSDAVSATVSFHNESGALRRIYWLDYSGTRYDFGSMVPGDVWPFGTFDTHPWVIADDGGTCLAIYVTEPGDHDVWIY